jgi:hypothetical protein
MCRRPLPHVSRSFNNDLECFSAIRSLFIISPEWARPVGLGPPWPISSPVHSPLLLVSSRTSTLLHVGPWHHFPCGLDKGTCRPRFNIFCPSPRSFTPSCFRPWTVWSHVHFVSCLLSGFMMFSQGAWWTLLGSLPVAESENRMVSPNTKFTNKIHKS